MIPILVISISGMVIHYTLRTELHMNEIKFINKMINSINHRLDKANKSFSDKSFDIRIKYLFDDFYYDLPSIENIYTIDDKLSKLEDYSKYLCDEYDKIIDKIIELKKMDKILKSNNSFLKSIKKKESKKAYKIIKSKYDLMMAEIFDLNIKDLELVNKFLKKSYKSPFKDWIEKEIRTGIPKSVDIKRQYLDLVWAEELP